MNICLLQYLQQVIQESCSSFLIQGWLSLPAGYLSQTLVGGRRQRAMKALAPSNTVCSPSTFPYLLEHHLSLTGSQRVTSRAMPTSLLLLHCKIRWKSRHTHMQPFRCPAGAGGLRCTLARWGSRKGPRGVTATELCLELQRMGRRCVESKYHRREEREGSLSAGAGHTSTAQRTRSRAHS